jgi:transposase InsO family protein
MEMTLSNLRSDYKLIYKVQPKTSMRIAALIEFVKIDQEFRDPRSKPGKRLKLLALCRGLDISIRTLFRWKKSYIQGGFVALTYKKAVGKRAQELTDVEKFLITEMRSKYRWGAEVIQAHLKRDEFISLSKYRIERYLTRSGLRDKYPCTTKKRRIKSKREHTKVVRIYHPGEHTQLDTKHQPSILKDGSKCYVFNFIDHASNWSYKRAYSKISPKSTIDFMNRLLDICPFKIERLQTDNGTEYTYRFYKQHIDTVKVHPLEVFCERKKIAQKLIPPGVKELQGLVERSHRQDDQELFSRIEPDEIDEFNDHLEEYYKERNQGRRYKKNDWRTPNEWLEDYRKTQVALRHGHLYKVEDLLPSLKIVEVSKLKKEEDVNNCKDLD